MSDKQALMNDWKMVGDDMRVAMGLVMQRVDMDAIQLNDRRAFIDGVLSINPFGNCAVSKLLPVFRRKPTR